MLTSQTEISYHKKIKLLWLPNKKMSENDIKKYETKKNKRSDVTKMARSNYLNQQVTSLTRANKTLIFQVSEKETMSSV